jgi:predicted Zn-dependent protease with MMP-like domain
LTRLGRIEEHGDSVTREHFIRLVEGVLESLPEEFRERIHNLAVFVEDRPRPLRKSRRVVEKGGLGKPRHLVLGVYQGRPATQRSVFDLSTGPDRIVLYQKNIEAVCSSEAEIRHEVRQTVLHELGHYFGMDEDQLKDV